MGKYLILAVLLCVAVVCFYQYYSNKKWETLVANKKQVFGGNRNLKFRTSDSYRSAFTLCSLALVAVLLVPNRIFDFSKSAQDSMQTDIHPQNKSAEIEEAATDAGRMLPAEEVKELFALGSVKEIREGEVVISVEESWNGELSEECTVTVEDYHGESEMSEGEEILIKVLELSSESLRAELYEVQNGESGALYYNPESGLFEAIQY